MQFASTQRSTTTFGKPPNKPTDVSPQQLCLPLEHVEKLLNTTMLAQKFAIRPTKMNAILSQIGWIKPTTNSRGWLLTESGKRFGGMQFAHNKSGRKYVLWPQAIASNPILVQTILGSGGNIPSYRGRKPYKIALDRAKFQNPPLPLLRATDGHFVRSRAELIIDNWLHSRRIAHEYERPLPFDDKQLCDFHINVGKGVYIEFWGYDSDAQYLARRQQKKQAYLTHRLQLVELDQDELSNLDYVLSRKLRSFGIHTQ